MPAVDILTHTNVAREEIESCLRSVPHGERLLLSPHFIGTIQSFVNRFLALPWLRAQQMNPENPVLGQREVIWLMDAGERLSQHFGMDLSSLLPKRSAAPAFPARQQTLLGMT